VAGRIATLRRTEGDRSVANKYLLIESRDPFETRQAEELYALAEALTRSGNEVTLFLVENGVLPARRSEYSAHLTQLADAGVQVLADEFSLRERGIAADAMATGVAAAALDIIIDQLEQGRKALWH
jgi:sulfur relay (sulfurtransferase) complex TusBCD TusD component (DsrE family)